MTPLEREVTVKRELLRRTRTNTLARYKPSKKQKEYHALGGQTEVRERLLLAANQVGKTICAGFEVAMHATGRYPWWWTGRRFDAPTHWLVGSEDFGTNKKGCQRILMGRDLDENLGTGAIPLDALLDYTRSRNGNDIVDMVYIRHQGGGTSTITFKCYEQGRRKWQADTVTGCIAEGQLVQMADGRCIPIETVEADQHVLTVDDRGRRVIRRVVAVHDRGMQETIEAETSRGPWIIATPDHQVFQTPKTKQRIDTASTVLTLPSKWEPQYCPVNLPDAYYAWMGLVIAEGTVSARKITMTAGEPVSMATALLPKGAYVRRKDYKEHQKHVPDWFLNWPDFWALMPAGLAHEKAVPDWVFMSPNAKIAVMLGYLYAGDGWASGHSIGYATTSRTLAEQVSMLLWRLGVRSSICKVPEKGEWREQYHVHVSSADNVLLFVETISVPGKAAAFEKVRQEAARRCVSKINRTCDVKGSRFGSKEDRAAYFADQNRRTRERVSAITDIRSAGVRHVYDLSIEQDHKFSVGMSIVSNCWFDEEAPEDIYFEGLTRTNATVGPILMTFTPLNGMSKVVARFLLEKAAGTGVVSMTIEDADHYTKEQKAQIISTYPEHERMARAMGLPTMGSGRIYTHAEENISYEATFQIPKHWKRINGIDFGWDHPFACVFCAYDADADTIYIYDCYRRSKELPVVHAEAIKGRGDWIPCAWPADGLQTEPGTGFPKAQQFRNAGCNFLIEQARLPETDSSDEETAKSRVSVEAGILDIDSRMATGRLKVAKHLNDWWEEYRLYHRKDGKVTDIRDDLMDATRYAVAMVRFADTEPRLARHRIALPAQGWRS